MSPFDDAMNPIRRAILSGRSVIAMDLRPRRLESLLIQAARVCGREADLRVVHLGWGGSDDRSYPCSRRIDRGSLPGLADLAFVTEALLSQESFMPGRAPAPPGPPYGRAVKKAYMELGQDDPGLTDLPPFDPAEAWDGRHIILLRNGYCDHGQAYLDWLAYEAIGRARLAGREPPLVALEQGTHHNLVKMVGWTTLAHRDGITLSGPAAWQQTLCVPDIAATAEWLAGAGRTLTPNGTPGCRRIGAGGRTVIARRGMHGDGLGQVEVFEVSEHRCLGASYVGVPEPARGDAVLDMLCRVVWEAGIGAALLDDSRLGGVDGYPMGDAVSWLLDPPPDMGLQPVAPESLDGIDAALMVAVGANARRDAVLRRIAADPALASRRRDFALTFPALADLLLEPGIAAGVDAGERVIPLLARSLDLSRAIVRRLCGRREFPQVGRRQSDREATLRFLSAIGHDRMPDAGDEAGWAAFLCCAGMALAGYADAGEQDPALVARLLLNVPGRDWPARLERLREVGANPGDVGDMPRALAPLLHQLGVPGPGYGMAYRLLARHGSLLRLLQACEAWHANPLLMQGSGMLPADAAWPVPFGTVDLGDGWQARALPSLADLRAEGAHGPDKDGIAGMGHCVATYGHACASGRSLVVSLTKGKDGGRVRVSTAELRPTPHGDWRLGTASFALAQHCGPRNRAPEPEAKAKLAWLRAVLASGEVPIDEAAIGERPVVTVSRDGKDLAGILVEWDAVLPPELRDLGPEGFREAATRILADGADRTPPPA